MSATLPKQRTKYKEKAADDFKLMKDSADYYLSQATFDSKLEELYKYASGTWLNKKNYRHIVNSLGLNPNNPKHAKILKRGSAAKLKNYPIILPIINMFMGEMRERVSEYIVKAVNSDFSLEQREELVKIATEIMQQQIVNEMNAGGIETGVDSQQVPPVDQAIEEYQEKYVDKRARIGQAAVNVIMEECRVIERKMKKFYHWIVGGYTISYREVRNDTLVNEVVSPLDFWYMASHDIDFIEDTEAQVRKLRNVPTAKVVDLLELTEKEERELLAGSGAAYGHQQGTSSISEERVHTLGESATAARQNNQMHDIFHVVWRTKRWEGNLHYYDELGEVQQMLVDEDYALSEEAGDIKIEERWVDEYWQLYKAGNTIYKKIEPITQRLTFSGEAKSCYNGRAYNDLHSENTSIVKIGVPFQEKVNEYHYRLDKTMAKNHDDIILIDISVIPNKEGLNRDDFMYFAKEHGFAFIDRSNKGADRSFNQYQVLKSTQLQYVVATFELINRWTMLYEEAVGVNRQRKGAIHASDGLGTSQNAVAQSYTMSEEIFSRFEEVEERDMQALLDYSKHAWRNGKQALFKGVDGRLELFETPEEYTEMEFQVVAKLSGKERKKVELYKQLLMPLIQNSGQQGAKPELFADLLDSESMSQVKKLAGTHAKLEQKMVAEQQQAQQQAQQQQTEVEMQIHQSEQETKLTIARESNDKDIEVALIRAEQMLYSDRFNETGGEEEVEALNDRHLDRQSKAAENL
jgi:hypothetical protein